MTRRFQGIHCIVAILCVIVSGCEDKAGEHDVSTRTTNKVGASAMHAAQIPPARAETASVRVFVQDFYDWYVPLALAHDTVRTWYHVLQSRDSLLSAGLALGLRTDSTVQADPAADPTNLNFDPFLSSQDPCKRYEVRTVRPEGANYRAIVRAVCSGPYPMPDVGLDVTRRGTSWQFTDVWYDSTDLRSLLCETAKEAAGKRPVAAELRCGAGG